MAKVKEQAKAAAYVWQSMAANKADDANEVVAANGRRKQAMLPAGQAAVLDALRQAINDAGETIGMNCIPRGAQCVRACLWRKYYYTASPLHAEAKKKAFNRGVTALTKRGTLGSWADWYWINGTLNVPERDICPAMCPATASRSGVRF